MNIKDILQAFTKTYELCNHPSVVSRWSKKILNCKLDFYSEASKRVVGLMETLLEKTLIQETQDINKQIQQLEELKQLTKEKERIFARKSLELNYQDSSWSAAASDSKTHIQCIVDRIVEFTKLRKFYQLGEAIDDAIDQIEKHQKTFPTEKLESKVFASIREGLNTHKQSLQIIKESFDNLEYVTSLNSKSNWHQLRVWAESLEKLGEELEDNIEIFPLVLFDKLEKFCEIIVSKSREKATTNRDRSQNRKEEWRRRVRYAAGFILSLIEIAREEAMQEDEEVIQGFLAISKLPFDDTWEDEGEI